MKRTGKNFALLCVGLVAASCAKELNNEIRNVVVPGEEIIFGAAASFENGDQKTKTEYGDPVTENGVGYVPLKWLTTDKIEIACPEAVNAQQATYRVSDEITNGTDGNSSSATLMRTSEKGLQWSAEETHHFYAMYPASSMFSDSERGSIGMGEGGVTGYMPVNQNPLKIVNTEGTELSTGNNDGNSSWIVNPDMRYAYMVAKNAYNTESEGNVTLTFKPIVTALEFDVTCPEIGTQGNGEAAIYITALSLHSSSNTNICGAFKYQFNQTAGEYDENDGILTDANTGTGYDRITMSMPNDGVKMANGKKLDVTFFLLPTVDFKGGDLKLDIFYTLNGSPFVKTATIGKEIQAKKKYFFSNLVLPAIAPNVKGSSWFSAMDPNTLISQLSIPVAGNAFSSYYVGSNSQYYKEQTLHYTELWDKGVRGFEFCTSYGCTTTKSTDWFGNDKYTYKNTGTLEDEYFVCNGEEMTSAISADGTTKVTFGNAFRTLATLLGNNQNECLIIICTYKSYNHDSGTGYNPQQYIDDLEQFLSDNPDINGQLVKLSPSSVVSDLKGKIAIIVRPGDDDYASTQNLTISNAKLTLVKDWGTSVDKWGKRFGSTYMDEGAFNTSGKLKIEDYLWGVGSSRSGTYSHSSYGPDFQAGYPTVDNFVFDHNTNESGQIVHIQEWARIVPDNSFATSKFCSGLTTSHPGGHDTYLWLQWPESCVQKQKMIKKTVGTSMSTMGGATENKIFINSLCGYYPVSTLATSFYPYNTNYQYDCLGSHRWNSYSPSFSLDGAGSGGDYVACAYDLNKWFYNWLTENEETQQGPVGLVMLNHIGNTSGGADDKSLDLVNWILMNNFKFPLATKQDPASANYDNEIEDGGNAIDFAN